MNDRHIQHQLMHCSIVPPPNVWTQIALCLNQDTAWQHVNSLEIPAPTATWEQVAAELSGVPVTTAAWQPLQTLAVWAPENTWQQLEWQVQQNVAATILSSNEIPPPANSWTAIAKALYRQQAPVLSLNRLLQIAAAAVVTGILLFIGFMYVNTPPATNKMAVATAPPISLSEKERMPPSVTPSVEESTVTTTVAVSNASIISRPVVATITSDNPLKKVMLHQAGIADADTTEFEEGRYLLALDASGDLVRVSPKLVQLPCAPNETGLTDAVAVLDSPACKEWLKQLRQRMALSTAGGGFGSPADLNELLKTTE